MKKRKKIHIGTALLLVLITLFMWWVNNFTISTNEYIVKSELINDEITIVHISDLHDTSYGKNNRILIRRILSQAPDFVAVTGDMFSRGSESGRERSLVFLTELAKFVTVYYVNGEHDDDESFFSALENGGVEVLNYEQKLITVKNTKLHLYGIDNVYFPQHFDLNNAFEPDDDNFSILLSHLGSKFKNFRSFGIDLTLSGDTHGGLFRLPYLGAVYDGIDFLPDKKGKLIKGLYEDGGSYIQVTGGLGNHPVPLRFYNRPEVAVIKLLPQ